MKLIIFIMFAGMIGAYGWAMRGTIIGGEKGSMLPGALLGILISVPYCHGGDIELHTISILAAAGAFSMFHGGSATYGETLNFVLRSEGEDPVYKGKFRKGMTGVFINGANWFALAAYFISISLQSITVLYSNYSRVELIVILLSVPFIQIIGEIIFNHPYNKKDKIYPKIYFSVTRREEWGSNLLLVIAAVIYSIIKQDYFSLFGVIFSFIIGGLGFVLGLYLYYKDVKDEFFGPLQRNGYIGNWKMMEMTIGFVGFIGVTAYFRLAKGLIKTEPVTNEISPINISENVYALIILVFLVIYMLILGIIGIYNKKNEEELSDHISDILMRPLFSSLPLLIVLLSQSVKVALIALSAMLNFVLIEKCLYSYLKKLKEKKFIIALQIIYLIISVYISFRHYYIGITALVIISILPYQLTALIKDYNINEIKKAKNDGGFLKHYKSAFTTDLIMTIETVLMIIGFIIID